MSFLKQLKTTPESGNKYIVKYDKKGFIKEVKQLFNYKTYPNPKKRPILDKEQLISILESDKKRRKL